MADNLLYTQGAGATISTDELGSGAHVQHVKLMDGTANGAALIGGDAANGLDVDVTRQPARTRTADAISAAQQTDALMNGLTALTPKFAKIDASASGDNTLVALVASKKLRVVALILNSGGTVSAKFQSGASGTDLTGPFALVAQGKIELPYNPLGWFETAAGVLLNLNLSGAIAVGGCLVYVEV